MSGGRNRPICSKRGAMFSYFERRLGGGGGVGGSRMDTNYFGLEIRTAIHVIVTL